MFIQTEETPNPLTLKFMPGKVLMEAGVREFLTSKEASASPLASGLMKIEGIKSVFFGRDFISVTKTEDKEWYALKPPVLGAIMEHFVSQEPLFYGQDDNLSKEEEKAGPSDPENQSIESEIKELLETRVRPAVAQDGGDIIFEKFEKGVVYVSLRGACSGCPSSSMTLKSGIENMLKYYIPEVLEVKAL